MLDSKSHQGDQADRLYKAAAPLGHRSEEEARTVYLETQLKPFSITSIWPASLATHGTAATREEAMAKFRAAWEKAKSALNRA